MTLAIPLTIQLNGQHRSFPNQITIAELLTTEGMQAKRIAVERNGEIVPRSTHEQTYLASGDRVEIVQAMGGG
jgi:sulfur carrier protein